MKIAPSILTSDFADLKNEIKSISNADYIHLDIMDGHFVPNMSFGPYVSKCISKITDKPLDIHLMVTDPLFWIDQFSFNNTKYITIHIEANNFLETVKKIKDLNIKVGVSVKPNTSIEELKEYLAEIDLVLVMTVEPGFGGQSFLSEAAKKIVKLNRLRKENNYHYLIEVDGGINQDTIKIIKDYGADIAVVGSFLFNQNNRNEMIDKLKK
ncbi:ribulose-phosphate 3-epimerase [Acholeplasma sp. OttesenSCG-928-E16]|nr:ribulose-phosphate 3-epimerase [Acholeplasma sp. OttesenSCG-928-E16]